MTEVGMVSRVEKVGFHKIDLGFLSTSGVLDNLSLCSFLKVLPVPQSFPSILETDLGMLSDRGDRSHDKLAY